MPSPKPNSYICMNIGIDGFCGYDVLSYPATSGLMTYTQQLIRSLSKTSANTLHVFQIKGGNRYNAANIKTHFLPINNLYKKNGSKHYFSGLTLPQKLDCFHGPIYTCPPKITCPTVITVHDMYFEIDPGDYPKQRVEFLKKYMYLSARKAKRIIVPSQATKSQLLDFVDLPEEKIKVVYLAADRIFKPVKNNHDLKGVKKKYKIGSEFILWVGSPRKRKNLPGLLLAFSFLKRQYKIPHQLLLIGTRWYRKAVMRLAEKLGLNTRSDIILASSVAYKDLVLLYNCADVFVFPTLHEGFGLTVLEAMACGTAVVTSRIKPLTEVFEDSALFVDPKNPEQIAQGVYSLLSYRDLRQRLRSASLKKAAQFSWTKTAAQTLEVYKDASEN